jgi:hypothetical protein
VLWLIAGQVPMTSDATESRMNNGFIIP